MSDTAVTIVSLTAGRRRDTALVDTPTPTLSWVVEAPQGDWTQQSAELRLDGDAVVRLDTRDSVHVPWPFDPIRAHATHTVEARVTGTDGSTSDWSEPLVVTAAFLEPGGWQAPFVALAHPERPAQPALLRTEFDVSAPLVRATLYATAHGVYQAEINGHEVDDAVLKPGWTAYQGRLVHETTDVTALVRPGRNAIGIVLAGGWYTEEFGFGANTTRFYGEQPDVAAQLVLEHEDGTRSVVATGQDWLATGDGPIRSSGIYAGEEVDARRAQEGWSSPGFDARAWTNARVVPHDVVPEAAVAEPVRRTQEVAVAEVVTTPSGRTILDFGQNVVGRLRLRVSGPAGHTVTVRHAEVLEHGELGTRPLRRAAATDRFTLAGTGEEVFEAQFTFHGFRYAEVENWPGDLDPAAVTAVVTHSDMRRTGWFDSSSELLNQLHENVVWGMRGNFLSVPTDCPQRDERLGWTGDIQVFAPTASYLFDCDAFLTSWLRDLAVEQSERAGLVPIVVPAVLRTFGDLPAAAWGDAATVVPSVLLERFADRDTLAAQYPSMRAWADYLLDRSGDRLLWEGDFQFGDWLDPDAPPAYPGKAKTDPDIVASAYLFRSTWLVARAAEILGHDEDARAYAARAEEVRLAFRAEYLTPAGRMMSDAPTAYALALTFDIVTEPDLRQALADRLAELCRQSAYHVGTGFVGTPILLDALVGGGHVEAAERLILQTENPSWLYAVTMGATTVWERWDSMLEDGTINPGEMTSFNHYAFGAVADWLHRSVAGLAPAAPGYARLRVAPLPLAGLEHARTSHETPYGLAEVGWQRAAGEVVVTATVPANTTAEVWLPGGDTPLTVGSGRHEWRVPSANGTGASAPLTVDSSLAAVADDPAAYRAFMEQLSAYDADAARRYRTNTPWQPRRTVRTTLTDAQVPFPVIETIDAALRRATAAAPHR